MKTSLTAALAALTLTLFSCAETDVVGKAAIASFDTFTKSLGTKVTWLEADGAFVLESPAGDKLAIAKDFARDNGMSSMGAADSKAPVAKMESPDFELEFEAAPFIAAGLDPSKLPASDTAQYLVEEGMFMIHFDVGSTQFTAIPSSAATVQGQLLQTFEQILATYRDRIGYHEQFDHYGLALGEGNMVEWAKDPAKNDKDFVFVLNPEPLVKAGLDPAKLTGWTLGKIKVKDAGGQTSEVEKLLKPFNL
ncbi:MAG: hypothetical protein WCG80_16510 [Spirochaetales bacterium]